MNAIIYLLRASDEDIDLFHKSINYVINHLNQTLVNSDVIIFHEKDFRVYKDDLISKYPFLKFIEIEFILPDFYNDKDIPEYYPHPTHGNGPIGWGHKGFTMGYRHMCRFFSGEIFKNEIIQQYDYVMRLDNDSFILRQVHFDIFDFMKENNYDYGYIKPAVQIDNPKVVEGLWEHSSKYFNASIPFENGKMYYTNFEVMKISWFHDNYMDYYEYLDNIGGFMTKRWGDAPVRYLGLNMINSKKYGFDNICYQHGAIYNK